MTATDKHDLSPSDCYGRGYKIGQRAKLGDDLPHPDNWPHPDSFYHGMRAALGGRGLDISIFLRVIEPSSKHLPAPGATPRAARRG